MVYGTSGHAKTQETDPFGIGGDPEVLSII